MQNLEITIAIPIKSRSRGHYPEASYGCLGASGALLKHLGVILGCLGCVLGAYYSVFGRLGAF